MAHVLKAFLEPKSIAIVGVSKTPNRPGHLILRNLREFGFAGDIYPVNPEGGKILGFKTYKSMKDLPKNIDLAVSMVPADDTLELLNDCADKGIKNVLLVSGGFSESGEIGANRQMEVVDLAKQKGIRIMGPNAVGPVNTSNSLVLHFYPMGYLKGRRSGIYSSERSILLPCHGTCYVIYAPWGKQIHRPGKLLRYRRG